MTFPVVQSVLDSAALEQAIAARYALASPVRCRLVSRGINDIYQLTAGLQRFALKVARSQRGDEAFAYEPALVAHLGRAGFAVPTPAAAADGAGFFTVDAPEGPRQVMVMRWLEGNALGKGMSEAVARELGATLARLHAAAGFFESPWPRPVPGLADLRAKLAPVVEAIGADASMRAFISRAVDTAIARLAALDPRSVPRGVCHGDFHYANLMLLPDDKLGIYDFSDCGEGFLAADLAPFFWRADFDGVGDPLNAAFVAGYETVRPLHDAERAALPLFRAARHLMVFARFAYDLNRVGPISGFDANLRYYLSMVRLYCAEAGIG